MFEIMPILDSNKNTPLYVQLYEYIKQEIQKGTIKPEMKLPSKRKLANYLGISQNTIQTAYEQLCAEGYVESKPRKGLFVTNIDDDLLHYPIHETKLNIDKDKKRDPEYIIDFNSGKVDLDYFPYSIWRKITIKSLFSDQSSILSLGEAQGEKCLREEISKYLFQSRGVRCSAEQIVIGSGTQFLLILLCMLIGKECSYAIENPGFHRARYIFKDQGIDVQPISVDEDGICIDELRKSSAKVVYVTPSHQFPNGMVMPISRRIDLLKWCEEKAGYIIEDDYDSEFRYKGKPIPSLQGLGNSENVIYMGTFSKSLIPSIRISYVVLPSTLINKYQEYYKVYKQTVSRLHQDTLYRFMEEGHWSRHLNKMRTVYRKKHKILLSSINKYMGEKVDIIGENAGLHILLKVKNGMSEEELIKTAFDIKIKVYPTSIYYDKYEDAEYPSIILGFGGLNEIQIEEGINMLKNAWLI
ncbi:PLP-dependent aminotransferase family protein [Clostridium beijerinckii]|uniref:MocR-like pyridoxine biosynthesis transcription factor PdxR n=1 Tax=Clostridium beijerinckii TaxID=1520 RepID=UPI0023301A7E|nr:PLP-dependent aminotransferase family protein [Clostridium beijerinckii]